MNLSAQQIAALWIQYGGDPSAAQTAAAIALAESSGDPSAINPRDTNGQPSYGLFQINGVHGSQATTDLATNVRAAISISNNGQNWRPWGTFTSGRYLDFLSAFPVQTSSPSAPADSSVALAPSGTLDIAAPQYDPAVVGLGIAFGFGILAFAVS